MVQTEYITSSAEMVSVHVSDGASPYAQPTVRYSTMDPGISFHDDIMLDNPEVEGPLDKLLETWRAANSETATITFIGHSALFH